MSGLYVADDAARLANEVEQSDSRAEAPLPLTRQRDFGTPLLLLLVALLLMCGALAFSNPFPVLAWQIADVAQPQTATAVHPAAAAVGEWCLRTDPYGERSRAGRFSDDGSSGDARAGDGIFWAEATFAEPGVHYWTAVACDDGRIALPAEPAWLITSTSEQTVQLRLDVNDRGSAAPAMWPAQFALSAQDDAVQPRAVGSFQNWKKDDPDSVMHLAGDGYYRVLYNIPQPGRHEALVVNELGDSWQAYAAEGRSLSWNGFVFETTAPDEAVVFELDAEAGRSLILHNIPPVLVWLAYQNGNTLVAAALAAVALLLAILVLARYRFLRRPDLQIAAGCPSCGTRHVVRVPRRKRDRLLTLATRYAHNMPRVCLARSTPRRTCGTNDCGSSEAPCSPCRTRSTISFCCSGSSWLTGRVAAAHTGDVQLALLSELGQ